MVRSGLSKLAAASLLSLCATGSCSSSSSNDTTSVEQLKAPALISAHINTCTTWFALDGDGQGWLSKGCEGGSVTFTKTHTVSEANRNEVAAAFAALPTTPVAGCDSAPAIGYTIRLQRTGPSAGTWMACTDKDAAGRQTLIKVYADADRLLTTAVGN